MKVKVEVSKTIVGRTTVYITTEDPYEFNSLGFCARRDGYVSPEGVRLHRNGASHYLRRGLVWLCLEYFP